jgi:hypothetical protein
MKKTLTALSFAAFAFAFAAVGAGAVPAPLQVADERQSYPTNAEENDVHFRQVAELTSHDEEYPDPSGDGDSPDIRFPGHPSA